MLLQLKLKNFKSFGGETLFSMLPKRVHKKKHHVFAADKNAPGVLRLGLCYGKNSAGKTNLIDAVSFARKMVRNDFKLSEGDKIDVPQYKFTEMPETFFDFIIRIDSLIYRYFFSVTKEKVTGEELYKINKWHAKEDMRVYELMLKREGDAIAAESLNRVGNEEFKVFLQNRSVKSNQLILNKLMEDGLRKYDEQTPQSKAFLDVYDWFGHIVTVYTNTAFGSWETMHEEKDFSPFINDFLHKADLGISKVDFKNTLVTDDELKEKYKTLKEGESAAYSKPNKRIIHKQDGELFIQELCTEHNGKTFMISEESRGSRRVLDLLPLFFMAHTPKYKNSLFLVDEFDTGLDSVLSKKLLDMFLNDAGINQNTQLIASTHEPELLDLGKETKAMVAEGKKSEGVRQDELFFFRRNAEGNTTIARIKEGKVRFDKALPRTYLNNTIYDFLEEDNQN